MLSTTRSAFIGGTSSRRVLLLNGRHFTQRIPPQLFRHLSTKSSALPLQDEQKAPTAESDDQKAHAESTSPSPTDWYVDPAFAERDDALRRQLETPRWMNASKSAAAAAAATNTAANTASNMASTTALPLNLSRVENVTALLVDHLHAHNVTVMDVRRRCGWCTYMVVCEGVNGAHVKRLADGLLKEAKRWRKTVDSSDAALMDRALEGNADGQQGQMSLPTRLVIEGAHCDDWKLLDLGSIVIHVFTPEARQLYNLEQLWSTPVGGDSDQQVLHTGDGDGGDLDATLFSSMLAGTVVRERAPPGGRMKSRRRRR